MNGLLQRTWRRALRRVGRPGLFGIALLVPAVAIALWSPRLTRQADELRAALAMQADTAPRRDLPSRPRLSRGAQAAEFVSAMPPLSQSADDLNTVFAIAARRKMTLPKGEYQLKVEPNAALVSYTVTLPVRSDYGALKGFSADVLEALPHGSMDELRMTRSDVGSTVLDAVVRFTLVYRSP
jgi:hypothetical protein